MPLRHAGDQHRATTGQPQPMEAMHVPRPDPSALSATPHGQEATAAGGGTVEHGEKAPLPSIVRGLRRPVSRDHDGCRDGGGPLLTLVCASQVLPAHFERATLLGRCLRQFPKPLRPRLYLQAGNRGPHCRGLPEIYNEAIDTLLNGAAAADSATDEENGEIVAFVHDDLFVHDWFLRIRLQEALRRFDLVGLAGEGQASADQGNWYFDRGSDGRWQWARRRPSGFLNHWDPTLVEPSVYGPTPRRCMVLDGVLLAARLAVLRRSGLRFDPQFRFHAYDIDVCRSALALGLTLGTWPIACTHGSGGNHDSLWEQEVGRYQAKWRDRPWPEPPPDDLTA